MRNQGLIPAVAAASIVVYLAGCGADAPAPDADSAAPEAETSVPSAAQLEQSANHMRHFAIGVQQYQMTVKRWPDSFDDLSPYTEGREGLAMLLVNPVTGDNPGYEYVKPADEDAVLSETIIVYQLRGGQRDETLPVCYGNGDVRLLEE